MPATRRERCRVEYRNREIVIDGPVEEVHREAYRIIRRFACSATPYCLARDSDTRIVLKPA
ncbi:MAG: hypothetical protein PVH31_01030 [Ectothiorhodospiraceae bacterium]|jgi:predicted nucleic acid-binding protein